MTVPDQFQLRDWRAEAQEHQRAKRFGAAVQAYRHAVQVSPGDADLWFSLASVLGELKKHQEAIDALRRGHTIRGDTPWTWSHLGWNYKVLGNMPEAIAAFRRAVTLDKTNDYAWRRLGECYQITEQPDLRLDALRHVADLCPKDVNAWNLLGIAYWQTGQTQAAINAYRRALETDPVAFAPLYNLGLLHRGEGQLLQAAQCFAQAVSANPQDTEAPIAFTRLRQRLANIAQHLRDIAPVVSAETPPYRGYLNPFELLQLDWQDVWERSILRRAKTQLLNEMKLNDGRVAWMGNVRLDSARASAVVEELDDIATRGWHGYIHIEKSLLRFLTHGDPSFFIYDPAEDEETAGVEDRDDRMPGSSPGRGMATAPPASSPSVEADRGSVNEDGELIPRYPPPATLADGWDEDFAEFIGGYFSERFNILLEQGVKRGDALLVEALGSRPIPVAAEKMGECFARTERFLDELHAQIVSRREEVGRSPDDCQKAEKSLRPVLRFEAINVLPAYFSEVRCQIAQTLRALSIDAYNKHSDIETAMLFLTAARSIRADAGTTARLKEDHLVLTWKAAVHEIERLTEAGKKAWVGAGQNRSSPMHELLTYLKQSLRVDQLNTNRAGFLDDVRNELAWSIRSAAIEAANTLHDYELAEQLLAVAASIRAGEEIAAKLREDAQQVHDIIQQRKAPTVRPYQPTRAQGVGHRTRTTAAYRGARRQELLQSLVVVVGIVVVLGVIIAVSSLHTCNKKPSEPTVSLPRSAPIPAPDFIPEKSPVPAAPRRVTWDTGLSRRINEGKAEATRLEGVISAWDSGLAEMKSQLDHYRRWINWYEDNANRGVAIDQSAYETTLANHNALVRRYNAGLESRKAVYRSYSQQIDAVNEMVRRYNSGER